MIDDDDGDDDGDDDDDGVENRYRPSICDSGGEDKFRRGPGLAFPRRSQRTEKNGDLTSEVNASGRHGDVTFDVQFKA